MKIHSLILGAVVALLTALAAGTIVSAQVFQSGDSVTIASGRTIDSALFASGNSVNIDGTVHGNLYCAGQTITIRGDIDGNVYCAGQTVNMEGRVRGSVHLAGQTISIGGTVGDDAMIAGQSVAIQEKGSIGRDLIGGTQTLTVDGSVVRDVTLGATSGVINGIVGRDLTAEIEQLTVGSSGRIGGNVDLVSARDPAIEQGGKIEGAVNRNAPEKPTQEQEFSLVGAITGFMYMLTAMLFLALTLTLLFPRPFYESAVRTMRNPGPVILTGFVAALALPMVIFLSLITFIGIPFALLVLLVGILLAVLSTPVAAYLAGHWLLRNSLERRKPLVVMLVGVGVLAVAYAIPFINIIAMIAAYLWGVGAIVREVVARVGAPRYVINENKTRKVTKV